MPASASLTWQIVYSHRGTVALMLIKGKASAIDAACHIIDAGGKVHRVEIGGTLVTLHTEQLWQIWNERNAARSVVEALN
jgi:hypothetical protein